MTAENKNKCVTVGNGEKDESKTKKVPETLTKSVIAAEKLSKEQAQEKSKDKEKELEKEKANEKKNDSLPKLTGKETHLKSCSAVYMFEEELGRGTFGAVYRVCRESDGKQFAVKCESVYVRKKVLEHEARILKATNELKSVHFVQMIDTGKVEERFTFIVLTLAGLNLWDLRLNLPEKKFSLNTALKISEQTLAGVRDLHRIGFIHRDIKPPNFAIGLPNEKDFHTIYALDFGLGRKICRKGKDIRTPRANCAFRGTTRYASMAAHTLVEQSRKDDIEAWWYMIAEMITGDIPWKAIKGNDREGVRLMKKGLRDDENAMKTMFNGVCFEQMSTILKYIDSLAYNNIPDYDYVYKQISIAMKANKITDKQPVDWDLKNDFYGPKYKCGEPYIVKELQ